MMMLHVGGAKRIEASKSPSKGRSRRGRVRASIPGWLFVVPLIIGVCVFNLYPMLLSLYTSFTDWNGFGTHTFVGIQQYLNIGKDNLFWQSARNTVYFSAGSIPLTVVIAFALALMCNNGRLRGRGIFRTLYFTPFVTNVVAISLVWFQLYTPNGGVVNRFLAIFGITGPSWLTSSTWAMPAVILVAVWHGVGYPMLILLGGLQGIPTVLYEAAQIDRASAWTRLWRITLPLVTPSLFFVIVTQIIVSFQIFGIIFVLTKGGPANATSVYIYNLYQSAFVLGNFGYSAALAWVLFVVILCLTLFQWRLQKKWVFYG